eukprot:gene19379-biopygen5498
MGTKGTASPDAQNKKKTKHQVKLPRAGIYAPLAALPRRAPAPPPCTGRNDRGHVCPGRVRGRFSLHLRLETRTLRTQGEELSSHMGAGAHDPALQTSLWENTPPDS